jgi:Zinc carboxypeptidase
LNRNFPDYFKQNTKRTQPETEAVKDWISKIQFLLSGSLHGGALVSLALFAFTSGRIDKTSKTDSHQTFLLSRLQVASYPFDNTPNASKYPLLNHRFAHPNLSALYLSRTLRAASSLILDTKHFY